MDRQDNESLHQQASEQYLQGDYNAALELWRTLHLQAPEDERASEGIRLCEMMSETSPDPVFEDEPGFDLGPILEEMPEAEPPGAETVQEEAVEQVLLDLDDMPETRLDAAAAAELVKRQDALLQEVRAAKAEGRLDDATGILARLFILDEDNAEAKTLEAEMRTQNTEAANEVDAKIVEAVQWMEHGRLEEAESNLRRALELMPGHQEAEHYLEQVLRRIEEAGHAGGTPDVEAQDGDPADAALEHGAVELDTGESEEIALGAVAVPDLSEDPAVEEPVQGTVFEDTSATVVEAPKTKPGVLTARNMILAAAVLALSAVGLYFGPGLLDRGSSSTEPEAASSFAEPNPTPSDLAGERSTAELIEQADALSRSAEEVSKADAEQIPGLVEEATLLMDDADYASAVITWNKILKMDPEHTGARRGLEDAGRRYREWQERSADLVRAGYIFEEGDYSSALKILYRLPEDIKPEMVRIHKANGWYNMAVISLKAGRIDQALERFGEIEALNVDDPGAAELQAFAQSYRGREKDRAFYQDVNELTFRTFDGK